MLRKFLPVIFLFGAIVVSTFYLGIFDSASDSHARGLGELWRRDRIFIRVPVNYLLQTADSALSPATNFPWIAEFLESDSLHFQATDVLILVDENSASNSTVAVRFPDATAASRCFRILHQQFKLDQNSAGPEFYVFSRTSVPLYLGLYKRSLYADPDSLRLSKRLTALQRAQHLGSDSLFRVVTQTLDPKQINLVFPFVSGSDSGFIGLDLVSRENVLLASGLAEPASDSTGVRSVNLSYAPRIMAWNRFLFPGIDLNKDDITVELQPTGTGRHTYAEFLLGEAETYESPAAPIPGKGSDDSRVWDYDHPVRWTGTPQIVVNYKTGNPNLIIQDEKGNLVCVNSRGRRLWSAPVTGSLYPAVFQLDILENNKLQYLLNTEDRVYIIDRLGNAVKGFPVKETCTGPLLLADYDADKDYRILVPTTRGLVNLNDAGKHVRGWNRFNPSEAITSIKYIRIGKRDYIIACTITGQLHALNRRGQIRYKTHITTGNNKGWVLIRENAIETSKVAFVTDTRWKLHTLAGKLVREAELPFTPDTLIGYTHKGRVFSLCTDYEQIGLIDGDGNIVYQGSSDGNPLLLSGHSEYPALIPSAGGYFLLHASGKTQWINLPPANGFQVVALSGSPYIVLVRGKELSLWPIRANA